MVNKRHSRFPLGAVATGFGVILVVSLVTYGTFWLLDFAELVDAPGPVDLMLAPEAGTALSGMGEIIVAVLGIALTVAAIIVELASQRYTPRIADLFIRDPINGVVMGFLVVTTTLVLWVSMSLHGPHYPRSMVALAVVMMSLSLALLLPYFAYVFDFVSPGRVIQRLRQRAEGAIRKAGRARRGLEDLRDEVRSGAEQLGDIVLNSIDKKDKAIAIDGLNALEELAVHHIGAKGTLPQQWFESYELSKHDPDFVALHPVMVGALEQRKTWVEMKILRQYQAAFNEAVLRVNDVTHLVAILTRNIGIAAAKASDTDALRLSVRFLNTYMRGSLNKRDVRSTYNVLNECRTLCEEILMVAPEANIIEIAGHMKFYGQLAFSMSLPFILETAAYDLAALLETAHRVASPCHDQLLTIFLDVDREPEDDKTQETSLRGVRKAQVKLATYYLVMGEETYARRILEDFRNEQRSRLASIRHELLSIAEPEYWEVSDRGINFDYVPPARRPHLERFFGWLEAREKPAEEVP